MSQRKSHTLMLMAVTSIVAACGGSDSDDPVMSSGVSIGGPSGGCDIFVDAAASGAGDGSSWSDAYTYLQDALDETSATPGSDFAICVAEGEYWPDEDMDGDHTDDDVQESFTFADDNASLYGGYPTGGGSRDPVANPSVLSGDIDDNDTKTAAGLVVSNSDVSGSNSHHVIEMVGDDGTPITTSTRTDGVIITAGDNRFGSGGEQAGGGVLCEVDGTGAECSPRFVRVVFQGNRAYSGGAAEFSAFDEAVVSPEFVNVQIRKNYADNVGAGMEFSLGSSASGAPVFVNALFDGNESDEAFRGGAYSNSTLQPTFVNSVFVNNAESLYNYAESGGTAGTNEPLLVNTIVWNEGHDIVDNNGVSTIRNSIIEGGWSGAGSNNLDQDPMFVDITGSDGIAGTPDDDLRLQSGSPAINAGDKQELLADVADLDADGDSAEATPRDLFENARVRDGEVDIGVHER